jgi:signal transduction histidine kinase/ActR/RegA family two-component response regulator
MNTSHHQLGDFIDTAELKAMMESFYEITKIPLGICDTDYKWLVTLGWEDICINFHRAFPASCANCLKSDRYIEDHLTAGRYVSYDCVHSLVDVAFPIVVQGEHLGTFFLGQFLHSPPDKEFFRAQAVRYGYDVEAYLQALDHVAVVSEERVDLLMSFFMRFVALITRIGHENLARKNIEIELRKLNHSLASTVAELEKARDAAEAGNRAKNTFLANMSHELRTPLNAITGMTYLALRKTTDPALRDRLSKIDTASKHLLHVISDILDIAKIEADRMSLAQTEFQLGAATKDAVDMICGEAEKKGLALKIDLLPELANRVFIGDPVRLGQILLNLLSNAVKFTERGAIELHVRASEETDSDVLLHWRVTDTGVGISATDQQRLFKPFEQVDGSLTREYGGTGLGLAISRRLAQLMGGDAGVSSQSNQGSTFWFTSRLKKSAKEIPVKAVAKEDAAANLEQRHAGARILVADDEPINRDVSRGLLEAVNLRVDTAKDGARALQLARENRYALILMDMQMPILNGLVAVRLIRADSLNTDTAIVALTANAFEEDRQKCLDAGMDDHIGRPIAAASFYEVILRWIEKPE